MWATEIWPFFQQVIISYLHDTIYLKIPNTLFWFGFFFIHIYLIYIVYISLRARNYMMWWIINEKFYGKIKYLHIVNVFVILIRYKRCFIRLTKYLFKYIIKWNGCQVRMRTILLLFFFFLIKRNWRLWKIWKYFV